MSNPKGLSFERISLLRIPRQKKDIRINIDSTRSINITRNEKMDSETRFLLAKALRLPPLS